MTTALLRNANHTPTLTLTPTLALTPPLALALALALPLAQTGPSPEPDRNAEPSHKPEQVLLDVFPEVELTEERNPEARTLNPNPKP